MKGSIFSTFWYVLDGLSIPLSDSNNDPLYIYDFTTIYGMGKNNAPQKALVIFACIYSSHNIKILQQKQNKPEAEAKLGIKQKQNEII